MNKLKNILIVILTAGLLVTSYYAWRCHRQKTYAEKRSVRNQKTVDMAATIISRLVDSSGRNHITIRADGNTLPAGWEKDGTAIKGGLIDTVAQALNIARKQLQEVTQIAITNQAKHLRAERAIDSLQRITYFYKGRYMQLAYRPAAKGADTTDHGRFDYQYNDSINVVQYWKRRWLLGARQSYIDIYPNDPNATINGVKRLVVKQKEPALGLRIQAVSNYDFSRRLMNIGPGVQFDINRFSLAGNYYYDFDAKQFRPSVGARYDLVRF